MDLRPAAWPRVFLKLLTLEFHAAASGGASVFGSSHQAISAIRVWDRILTIKNVPLRNAHVFQKLPCGVEHPSAFPSMLRDALDGVIEAQVGSQTSPQQIQDVF
jgi:hypothetical protein